LGILGLLAVAMGVSEHNPVSRAEVFHPSLFIRAAIYWLILSIVFLVLDALLQHLFNRGTDRINEGEGVRHRLSFALDRRGLMTTAGVIALCWLPYFFAYYPGVVFSDTALQLSTFFGSPDTTYSLAVPGMRFSDHHPLFDTLFMGAFVWLGQTLTGSANIGFALLCLVQIVLLSLSAALLCCYLRERGLSHRFCLVSMLFFCLFPLFPYLAMSPVKDTLFIGAYLPFLIGFCEFVRTKGQVLRSGRNLALAVLVCLLLALTKKPGIYILLFCGLIALVAFRKEFRTLLIVLGAPLVIVQIVLPLFVFPALSVAPGSKVEMLGPLYQQTARYVHDYPDEITDEERAILDSLLGYDTLGERYNPSYVDVVIHDTSVERLPSISQITDYLGVYLSQGIKHPLCYAKAIAGVEGGWFDIGERYRLGINYGMPYEPANGQPNITRPEAFVPFAQSALRAVEWLGLLPVIDLLFIPGLYTTFIPCFSFLLVVRHLVRQRRENRENRGDSPKRLLLCFAPVVASLIFLYLSPVSTVSTNVEALRYTLSFLCMTPLIVGFVFIKPRGIVKSGKMEGDAVAQKGDAPI
jgi:hypothetical protein